MGNRTLKGRYVLEAELGSGGMGVIYRAIDRQLQRQVAVKILPAHFTQELDHIYRFVLEVLNAAKLNHPNIVQIYDAGKDADTYYFVMQLIEGSALRQIIMKHGRFPLLETVRLLTPVAEALDYAHERGVIHRDIKPENILIDAHGNVYVVDFGIAKSMEISHATVGFMGSPEYSSPEQATGDRITGRTDQYSLAVVAYEMLTGTTPFRGDNNSLWTIIKKHVSSPPPDPCQICDTLPTHLCPVICTALAKTPAERFDNCVEFIHAISGLEKTFMADKAKALAISPASNYKPTKHVSSAGITHGEIAQKSSEVFPTMGTQPKGNRALVGSTLTQIAMEATDTLRTVINQSMAKTQLLTSRKRPVKTPLPTSRTRLAKQLFVALTLCPILAVCAYLMKPGKQSTKLSHPHPTATAPVSHHKKKTRKPRRPSHRLRAAPVSVNPQHEIMPDQFIRYDSTNQQHRTDIVDKTPVRRLSPVTLPSSQNRYLVMTCPLTHLRATPWCPYVQAVTYYHGKRPYPPTQPCTVHAGPSTVPAVVKHERHPRSNVSPMNIAKDAVTIEICAETGKIATRKCPVVLRRYFKPTDVPTETCSMHPE